MTPPLHRHDMTDQRDCADIADVWAWKDAMEKSDIAEPTDPIEAADPMEPIDRIEPFEAIDRTESDDHRDHRELLTRPSSPRGNPGDDRHVNRLADSASPYLLQHADNPVDWYEWGPEAFAEAERSDRPILLSVGYAACHWCHVMAHESFEDITTAAVMNAGFVNIKVDREERPDVDAVYMDYVTALTGQGGWPMTVFATPDGKPFFAGTYFPPQPYAGRPSFRQVLEAIGETWQGRRDEVLDAAGRIGEGLAERTSVGSGANVPPSAEQVARGVAVLRRTYDGTGFGGAPKFPPSMVLEWLLRHHARTGNEQALEMVRGTAEAMARGGIYDQLGGGFARYSVDAGWVVPHFEKMLYDNALLLRVYVHLWRATGDVLARRVVMETAEFLLRDLRTPEGGFASALDADTDGVEGSTYVWTPDHLHSYLDDADADWAAELLSVNEEGTFELDASTLQLLHDPDDPKRWALIRQRLLDIRQQRPQPARDDKVVTAWNGLAIAALAEAGAVFDVPEWIDAATTAADLLLDVHRVEGRLVRVSREGRAGRHLGVLEDYADLAEGLLALYAVTGEAVRLAAAGELLDVVLDRFADGAGGFYDTADDAEPLLKRPQGPPDNATPSGQAAAAGALLTYAALTGSHRHRAAAEEALGVYAVLGPEHPRFAGWGLAVAEALLDGPREVAIVGPAGDAGTLALRRTALQATAPGLVLAVGDPLEPASAPLLAERPLVDGAAAAYVCRGFVCERPVTEPDDLAAALAATV
jgi:uncharacterized protein